MIDININELPQHSKFVLMNMKFEKLIQQSYIDKPLLYFIHFINSKYNSIQVWYWSTLKAYCFIFNNIHNTERCKRPISKTGIFISRHGELSHASIFYHNF